MNSHHTSEMLPSSKEEISYQKERKSRKKLFSQAGKWRLGGLIQTKKKKNKKMEEEKHKVKEGGTSRTKE